MDVVHASRVAARPLHCFNFNGLSIGRPLPYQDPTVHPSSNLISLQFLFRLYVFGRVYTVKIITDRFHNIILDLRSFNTCINQLSFSLSHYLSNFFPWRSKPSGKVPKIVGKNFPWRLPSGNKRHRKYTFLEVELSLSAKYPSGKILTFLVGYGTVRKGSCFLPVNHVFYIDKLIELHSRSFWHKLNDEPFNHKKTINMSLYSNVSIHISSSLKIHTWNCQPKSYMEL